MILKKQISFMNLNENVRVAKCWIMPGRYFYYWTDAQIYKTKKGNYFLHLDAAEGYEEKIETIAEIEVKELIRELNPDKYLELFGTIDLEEA